MARTAGVVASVIVVLIWLVFSYWPAGAAALPTLAFGEGASAWLAASAVTLLVIAAAIQAWIVYATAQSLRKPADAAQAAVVRQFNLRVGTEALLTAAPLVFTLAFVAWIWL